MNDQRGRADKIAREIAEVSPLALPQYLAECEFYDMEDTRDVLDRAVSEFEDAGGVGASLADTVVVSLANSCTLLLFKKFHEPTYRKVVKGKLNISQIVDRCLNFQYPASPPSPVQTPSQALQHDKLRRDASGIDRDYNGKKDYRDMRQPTKENPEGNRNSQFRNSQFPESGTAKDITGRDVHTRESAPTGADGKPLRSKVGEADHVKPLKRIHDENGSFVRRYSDEDDIKGIVNSDENFQLLAGDMNASKGGGKTNKEFIEYVEAIDSASEIYQKPEDQWTDEDKAVLKKLNGTQKKTARLKARAKTGQLTEDERRALAKHELSDEAKKALLKKQEQSEKFLRNQLLQSGGKTVLLEQIGKIVETLVGPLAFEIRDSFRNGVSHGFDDVNAFEAITKRFWRVLCHLWRELPRLVGDLLGDLSQMVATFFMTMWKVIRDIFGKFLDVVVSGISVLVDSVKILMTPNMTAAQRGDAIVKIAVGFVTGVLGSFVIDKALNAIGIPDPFSEIAAVLAAGAISTIVMHFFDKLDIFNLKREVRLRRIEEIFEARAQATRDATARFDLAVFERLKAERKQQEERRARLDTALEAGDFETVNEEIDDIASSFKVDIPYASTAEFIKFVRDNDKIVISA